MSMENITAVEALDCLIGAGAAIKQQWAKEGSKTDGSWSPFLLINDWEGWRDTTKEKVSELQSRIASLEEVILDIAVAIEHPEYIHVVAGDQYRMLCPNSGINVNTTASWITIGGAGFGRSLHKVREKADRLKAAVAKALELVNGGE